MKRAAAEVSDLETPESSRPMLALDGTRHRPNNPELDIQQQPSSDPIPSLSTVDGSKSKSDGNKLPVPQHEQLNSSSASLQPSLPSVAENPTNDAVDSIIPQPPSAGVPLPISSHPRHLDSEMVSPQPITSLSGLDRRSPIVQSMLREAFKEGRSEERQQNQDKLDAAESKIEELRKRLDPSKLMEAYDRGFREGGLEGYNKYSLNPETKASDDRLAFEKICKEKDQAIHNQNLTLAKYQEELIAKRRLIQDLEQQAGISAPQTPTQQQSQNISSQQILDAEVRFSAQTQELAVTKSQNELMRADLGNWQVQWGLITADLEKWKAAFSTKASQLDACQRQLDNAKRELNESKGEISRSAVTKSEEIGSLKAAAKELDELYTTLTKEAAETSAELKSVKALNEELKSNSKQAKDGKEEINALTSINNELAKLRGDLEKTVARQAEEVQDLLAENDELARKLKEREEEDERAPLNPNNAPSQADEQQTEELGNLSAELAEETAAADSELARIMLERERAKAEADNSRREERITATLEGMEETEHRRRQMLIDELEDKDAQLYDAQKQIRELNEKLLAASPSQPLQSPTSAPSSSSPPAASPSPTIQPPASPELSALTIPAAGATSWFRLLCLPATYAQTNFSPRRLVIMLFIFLLTFLVPYLHSFSTRPATEDNENSGQVAIEVLSAEDVMTISEAFENKRRRLLAWGMTNWERNERIARGEELGNAEEEYRPIPGLEY